MGAPLRKQARTRYQVQLEIISKMKAPLTLALLVAIATTSATETGTNTHNRVKRAIPLIPLAIAYAKYSGDSSPDALPPGVDPNFGSTAEQINSMATSTSMSGPLAVLGGLNVLASLVMAMNYFQAVNARRRSDYASGGQYIQKRSSLNINPESIVSFINSFR